MTHLNVGCSQVLTSELSTRAETPPCCLHDHCSCLPLHQYWKLKLQPCTLRICLT